MSELVDAKRHSGHCTEGTIHIRMQRDASIDDPLGVDTEGGLSCWRRAQSSSFARAARPKSSPGDEIRGRRLKHVSASTVTRHRSQGGMIAPEKMIAEIRMGKKLAELHVRLAVLEAAQQARPRSPGKTGRSRSRDQIARTQSQPKPMLAEAPDIGTPPEIMQGIGQLARQSTKQALGLASASGASMWQLGETMMDMAKEGTHLNIQEDYIYRYGGAPAHVLLFFGGHYRFRSSAVQGVYLFVWLLSFLSCGAVCLINLYFQAIPFHNVPTDLLTGYIHFPVMQGWLFWRRRQDDTLEVVRERIAAKELARFEWEVKTGSWLLRPDEFPLST